MSIVQVYMRIFLYLRYTKNFLCISRKENFSQQTLVNTKNKLEMFNTDYIEFGMQDKVEYPHVSSVSRENCYYVLGTTNNCNALVNTREHLGLLRSMKLRVNGFLYRWCIKLPNVVRLLLHSSLVSVRFTQSWYTFSC